jgi:hypothetical protein
VTLWQEGGEVVIRFKCIYCGQRILAKDDGRGKQGKCPKCAHLLTIPESTKGRPAISFDKEPMPDRSKPHIPAWEKGSGFDKNNAEEELIGLFKESFGFLIPTYDKLSVLLMSLTFILLFMTNSQMRVLIPNANETSQTESFAFVTKYTLILTFSIVLFIQIFVQKEDIDLKKKIMVFFVVLINACTGIIAGIYAMINTATSNWLLVFPIWNITNCFLMLCMLFSRIIDEECISDRKTTLFRICFGLIAILIIFFVCNNVFKLYWAITFSICIVYTTSFDRALQSVFPGLSRREDEQNA